MISIESLLISASLDNLVFDSNIGIKGGHNGPYLDPETPVRVTAHWLVVFCCLYKRLGKVEYLNAAKSAIDYLTSSEARPMEAAFYCRINPKKDLCNGLMGQAWVIEALLYAYDVLKDQELYDLAESTFLAHEFDETRGLWRRLSVDGTIMDFDETFNHQLWFCAVGSKLKSSEKALNNCDRFFKVNASKPELYSDGVIFHDSNVFRFGLERRHGVRPVINYVLNKIGAIRNKMALYSKSVGYHGFNMYAYELMRDRYGANEFYKSKTYKKMVGVVNSKDFIEALEASQYGYPYNPPGFELGYVMLQNGYTEKEVVAFLELHFSKTAGEKGVNSARSKDIETSQARLYELVRLLDIADLQLTIK
ncbi:MAG: hypothetical protein P8X74_08370 [Reinekea sp.]